MAFHRGSRSESGSEIKLRADRAPFLTLTSRPDRGDQPAGGLVRIALQEQLRQARVLVAVLALALDNLDRPDLERTTWARGRSFD